MTTAQELAEAPDIHAILRDRWDTLTIGVFIGDGSERPSALITHWMDATRTLAARMVHGIQDGDHPKEPEYELLSRLEQDLLTVLEDRVLAFAEECEAIRSQVELQAALGAA